MGSVNSDIIANLVAGTKSSSKNTGGNVQVSTGIKALGTGDIDAADIVHLCVVPFSAKIKSIKIFNDDLDSNGTPTLVYDLGVYYGEDGLTYSQFDAVDIDCYVDGSASGGTDLQAANTTGAELAYVARGIEVDQEVWEDAGLSANPGGLALISLTISTGAATAAAGDVKLVVEYIND